MFDFCGCPDAASTTHICPLVATVCGACGQAYGDVAHVCQSIVKPCGICGQACGDVTHICRISNMVSKVDTIPTAFIVGLTTRFQ